MPSFSTTTVRRFPPSPHRSPLPSHQRHVPHGPPPRDRARVDIHRPQALPLGLHTPVRPSPSSTAAPHPPQPGHQLLCRPARRHHPCRPRQAKAQRVRRRNILRHGPVHPRLRPPHRPLHFPAPAVRPQRHQHVCHRHVRPDRRRNVLRRRHPSGSHLHGWLPGRLSLRATLPAVRVLVRKAGPPHQPLRRHSSEPLPPLLFPQTRRSVLPCFLPPLTFIFLLDRIVSVVSDHKRNCLYTLSAKNVISLYHLPSEKTVQHAQTLANLYKAAQEKAPASPTINPSNFQIIALHVVDPAESRVGVQLMAITINGVRLYFSPASPSFSYAPTTNPPGALRPLQLVHVRLPPPSLFHPDELARPSSRAPSTSYSAARVAPPPSPSRPFIVSGLENSCYQDGLTISAQPGDTDGTDFLLCTSPDLTRIGTLGQASTSPQQYVATSQPATYAPSSYATSGNQRPPLTEYATLLAIPGRTWAMASVPRPSLPPSTAPSPAVTNELALQFSEPPRQFMILTNVGLTFLVKRRALDYLRAVIEEAQSEGTVQPIIEFRDRRVLFCRPRHGHTDAPCSFGRDQTCAMLLGLACGNTFMDTGDHSMPGTLCTVSPDVANIAKQAFYDFGERPIWTERVTYGTSMFLSRFSLGA